MNKVILMSIQSKWLVKILNGDKTIEIRKSMPKCELPIDVYLYCTNGHGSLHRYENDKKWFIGHYKNLANSNAMNGKVVAKFTLNNVDEYEHLDNGYDFSKFVCSKANDMVFDDYKPTQFELKSCLEYDDIVIYAWNKKYGKLSKINNIYAWHIDNLVIFDKPKELREFSIFKRETITCGMDCPPYTDWVEYRVYRAPQSWQYAYVKENKLK